MKASKWVFCIFALSSSIIFFSLVLCLVFKSSPFCSENGFGCDMKHRRAEVLCSYTGVNPFHVWNHEIQVKGFVPMARPDMPSVNALPGDLVVHNYPVWHTVWFWLYGRLPESVCIGVMALLFGASAFFFLSWIGQKFKAAKFDTLMALVFIVSMSIESFIGCFFLLNYGIMFVGAVLLMIIFLKENRQLLAGLCWSFLMIKPQVGLLFIFPLLFSRKYRTVVTAIFICSCMTLGMALYYHESPMSLLLQIPKIGVPYQNSVFIRCLTPLFGAAASYVWMCVLSIICAYLCFTVSKHDSWFVRIAPVILCFPVWTYSNGFDTVLQVFWYAVVAFEMCSSCADERTHKLKPWVWYGFYSCLMALFMAVWNNFCNLGIFDSAGFGWIYHLFVFVHFVVSLVYIRLFLTTRAVVQPLHDSR